MQGILPLVIRLSTPVVIILRGVSVATAFGNEIRRLREVLGWNQEKLAEETGVKQTMITQWETGRKTSIKDDTLRRLAAALKVEPALLANLLPVNHNARRLVAVDIPVAGVVGAVAAGVGRDEPADPDDWLRVSEMSAGCVAYRVRGESMEEDKIFNGDYLVVKPSVEHAPVPGDVVVAWIANKEGDGGGHVVKRLEQNGYLKSKGKGRWSHKLCDRDQVFGVLVGVVRVCS